MDEFHNDNSWSVEIKTIIQHDTVLLKQFPIRTKVFRNECFEEIGDHTLILKVKNKKNDIENVFEAIAILSESNTEMCIWEGFILLQTQSDFSYVLHTSVLDGHISFYIEIENLRVGKNGIKGFQLFVLLNSKCFQPLGDPIDDAQVKKSAFSRVKKNLKYLFQHMFELKDDVIQYKPVYSSKKKTVEELYKYIQQGCLTQYKGLSQDTIDLYQHSSLLPTIRKYQARAVHWMHSREKQEETNADENGIHPLWQEICCIDGNLIYLNVYSGKLTREIPPPTLYPKGGILSDEMGLGKTVEVLALHLTNPKPIRFHLPLKGNETAEPHHFSVSNSEEYSSDGKRTLNIAVTNNEEIIPQKSLKLEDQKNVLLYSPLTGNIIDKKNKSIQCENKQVRGLESEETAQDVTNKTVGYNLIQSLTQKIPTKMYTNEENPTISSPNETVFLGAVGHNIKMRENDSNFGSSPDILKVSDMNSHKTNSMAKKESNKVIECEIFDLMNHLLDECVKELENPQTTSPTKPVKNCTKKKKNEKLVKRTSTEPDWCETVIHGDYLVYTNNSESMHRCCICSLDTTNGGAENVEVECCKCSNVMHEECAGYEMKDVMQYECPTCAMKDTVDSHCTLIVCPDTLQKQWFDEVSMHVKEGDLKYMIYYGVKHHRFLQPKLLAEYDIIITSFNTLRLDFNYVMSDDASRKLRHRKRYASLPCPLLAVNFWRMCIDEAQIVETNNTKLAEMALRITAVNRWCVTGTPFTRDVEDIYGLLLFLGVWPYCQRVWWQRALYDYYLYGDCAPLFNLTSKFMWRSCKKDVLDEICLPLQTEHVSWLHFNAVEGHFYQQQLKKYASSAETKLRRLASNAEAIVRENDSNVVIHPKRTSLNPETVSDSRNISIQSDCETSSSFYNSQSIKLSELSKNDINHILTPLLQLRQACIHPAAVRNTYLSMEKKCVTMDEVLKKLMDNARLECDEAHRKLICSLNGLAGVELLDKNIKAAADYYKQAIDSWTKNEQFKTDALQKLHTYHNICEVFPFIQELENKPDLELPEMLRKNVTIRREYMSVVNDNVKSADNAFKKAKTDVAKHYSKVDWGLVWWVSAINQANGTEELLDTIQKNLNSSNTISNVMLRGKFNSLTGLKFIIHEKLKAIQRVRGDILESLKRISTEPSKEVVLQAAECCLRPVEVSNAPRCQFCIVDDGIQDYEQYLFAHQPQQGVIAESTRGLRLDTDVDIVLKTIQNFIKKVNPNSQTFHASKEHFKYIESLKKEFKSIQSLFLACHGRAQSIDELDMCTMRMRFSLPDEEDVEKKSYVIRPTEVAMTRMSLLSDKTIATVELKTKQGHWLYLKNIAKVHSEHDGYNPEPCPICDVPLGVEWSVFACGHCVCCRCVVKLQNQRYSVFVSGSRSVFRCPFCRMAMKSQDVSFVVTKQKKIEGFDSHVVVKGHHSTKIEAIVRRILWINETDTGAKILVFSTWNNVLQLIASALQENEILYKNFDGTAKNTQKTLKTFKESQFYNVLLLCLLSGSKGLNIIEATHVIFAEPALNPWDEFQAVGRIHRIGQTKETHVHRFYVKGTVEERMFNLFKHKRPDERVGKVDTTLTIGDLSSLFKAEDVPAVTEVSGEESRQLEE